jgi:hypothetical protein
VIADPESFNTETPSSGAVTSEVITQMSAGIPPSNTQLHDVIDTTNQFLERKQREPSLSTKTRKTVADVETVLKDAKQFMDEKNPDETLQSIFIQSKVAAESMAVKARSGTAGEVVDIAGDLARLMVSSSEFRNHLLDLTGILESVLYLSNEAKEQHHHHHRLSGEDIEREGVALDQQGFPGTTTTTYISRTSPATYVPTTVTTSYVPMSTSTGSSPVQYPSGRSGSPTSSISESSTLREALGHYGPGASNWNIRDTASFTDEERRNLRVRLQRSLSSIASNPDFKTGLESLLKLGGLIKKEVHDTLYNRPITTDPNMLQIMAEAKVFLQRFSGEQTIDKLISDVKSLLRLIMDDPLLNRYFDELADFFQELAARPHAITDESSFVRRLDDMVNRGLNLLVSIQQKPYLRHIIEESKLILNAIRDDPIRRKMAADLKVLASDFITYGKDGKPVLNLELVSQLKSLMVPLLSEHLRDVPIPRITGSNDKYDYWIDNLAFSVGDLLPDQMHMHVDADSDIDVQHLSTQRLVTRMVLSARGIRTVMKDIHFWFNRKSFPRTEDEGFATVEMAGDRGASVLIQLTFSPERNFPFDVHAVRFNIDDLNIKISETRHDWLYNMFTSLYKNTIKERVEQEVQLRLRSIIYKINHQMNAIFCSVKAGAADTVSNMVIGGAKITNASAGSTLTSGMSSLLSR